MSSSENSCAPATNFESTKKSLPRRVLPAGTSTTTACSTSALYTLSQNGSRLPTPSRSAAKSASPAVASTSARNAAEAPKPR